MIRSIFRLVEQCNGFFGYIATHEIYFYLLDATPIFLSVVLFVFVWPTRYVAGTTAARKDMGVSLTANAAARTSSGSSWEGNGRAETGGGYAETGRGKTGRQQGRGGQGHPVDDGGWGYPAARDGRQVTVGRQGCPQWQGQPMRTGGGGRQQGGYY
ncbi:hypothetical protein JCM8547_005227 [Rhodosporidiobolus lusitaniae]